MPELAPPADSRSRPTASRKISGGSILGRRRIARGRISISSPTAIAISITAVEIAYSLQSIVVPTITLSHARAIVPANGPSMILSARRSGAVRSIS